MLSAVAVQNRIIGRTFLSVLAAEETARRRSTTGLRSLRCASHTSKFAILLDISTLCGQMQPRGVSWSGLTCEGCNIVVLNRNALLSCLGQRRCL